MVGVGPNRFRKGHGGIPVHRISAAAIRNFRAPAGGMALFWLGNSSWAVVLDSGKVIHIDPMLSHSVYRLNKWERLQPVPFPPAEADCDLVLVTHGHFDHLDPDTIPDLARVTGARFVVPTAYAGRLQELGVASERIIPVEREQEIEQLGVRIRTVKAFHMHPKNPQPHAVGYVLSYCGASVYHAGDTAYVEEVRESAMAAGPITVALLPINGKRCCLTTEDAAFLAEDVQAKVVVPMHYGMFIENNGDPYELMDYMRRYGAQARTIVVPFLGGLCVTAETQELTTL